MLNPLTPLERFEILATPLYRKTGKLAPGKDRPVPARESNESRQIRYTAYDNWRWDDHAREALSAALERIAELEAEVKAHI